MVNPTLLTFNEDTHTYRYDGQVVISTTQVLSDLSDFSKIPKSILQTAQERGTEVHKAIELYNETEIIDIDESLVGYFNSYLKFKEMFDHKSLLNEIQFYSQLGYAGTCDSYGLVMGQKSVIDYKTTSAFNQSLVIKTGIQLSAYRNGLIENGHEVEQGVLVNLKPNKMPKVIFYTTKELDEYFEYFKKMLDYKKLIKYLGGDIK